MPPTLTPNDLVEQQEPLQIPVQEVTETPTDFVNRAVSPIIQANTAEAQQRDQVFDQLQQVGQDRPSFDQEFTSQLNRLGTPDAVNRLRDVQTQLNSLNTQFDVQNVQIAEGNSIGQAQREVSQNDRERAVRTAGLAAQSQILQGNIQTAQSIARDTVNFAFQDEQNRLNQLKAQYNALDGRVQGQEAQMLAERQRLLEEEQSELNEVRDQVALALQSGAQPDEVALMTDPNTPLQERLVLAQEISARYATEQINLSNEQKRAQMQKLRASNTATTNAGTNAIVESGVMGTGDDPIPGLLLQTAGGRLLTQSEAEPLTNAKRVADGLQDLQDTLAGANTDPVLGLFRQVNPYDLKAATIDAAITQLVPQLARGTYGEVGVLTDADMARYANTLPNLTSTEAQNAAIMALTLRKVRSGFVSQLESMAAAGRDVSGFVDIYSKFNEQISALEGQIGVENTDTADFDAEFDEFTSSPEEESPGFWARVGNFFFGS